MSSRPRPNFHHFLLYRIRYKRISSRNDSEGCLNLEVYYHETLENGSSIYFVFLKEFFGGCYPKSPAPKTFSLRIEQGASRDDLELVLCATIFLRSISDTTSLERMILREVLVKALTFHFEFLHIGLGSIPFPNLQQTQIDTAPLRDLVAEDVRVECFRDSVDMSEDEEDDDDDGVVGDAESGSYDSDWESWASGKWPRAASETRGLTGTW